MLMIACLCLDLALAAAMVSHGDLWRTIDLDVDIGADAVDYK